MGVSGLKGSRERAWRERSRDNWRICSEGSTAEELGGIWNKFKEVFWVLFFSEIL